MDTFGSRIRKLRIESGQSVDELSKKLGVCVDTIWKLESGRRGRMYEKIPALARALGCSIDDLFCGLENEGSEKSNEKKTDSLADEWED